MYTSLHYLVAGIRFIERRIRYGYGSTSLNNNLKLIRRCRMPIYKSLIEEKLSRDVFVLI